MPPSKRNVTLSQLRVGIFVLIAIGVLIFLVLNASGDINPFSRKLHLKARFVDANGLREGSEVRLAGVRVGKVERIVLLEPSPVAGAPRVEAQMTLDSTIDGRPAHERIRSDSTAQQGSPSLLGNEMLINITPGSVTIDLSGDRRTLFVHVMHMTSPESSRSEIKAGFEQRVKRLFESPRRKDEHA